MNYTRQEVMQFVKEEDVKFIRLTFCDVFGRLKNISIMDNELERAFNVGIAIDASAVDGFGDEAHSDLFLHPDPDTLAILPWRPEHGRVVRMFCAITYPNGDSFESDTRKILIDAVKTAKDKGYEFAFGPEIEFYLFKLDEHGNVTDTPYDNAGYMDMIPYDRGENIRREICLTLEQMGIYPESSHHEEGPGQNEIDFRYSDPVSAADNAMTFKSVVNAVVFHNGVGVSFAPKPIKDEAGNGFHINMSVHSNNGEKSEDVVKSAIAGVLKHVSEMTAFLNTTDESYKRFGGNKAPKYISWSFENRSQLIRVPAYRSDEYGRMELRSPDPSANPYIAFALIIYAALDGIEHGYNLSKPCNVNLFTADEETKAHYKTLPLTLADANAGAKASGFIKRCLPKSVIETYVNRK